MSKPLLTLSCLTLSAALLPAAENPTRCGPRPERPLPVSDAQALASGRSAFAFEVNRRLAFEQSGNLAWSPTSLHNAFMTLYAGAEGTSAAALERLLALPSAEGAPWSLDRLYGAYESLHGLYLSDDERRGELVLAEAMFLAEGFPFRGELIAYLEEARGVETSSVDFADQATVSLINGWVEDKTRGMIAELLRPGDISPASKLAVLNTMYFASQWESKFRRSLTAPRPFHLPGAEPVSVPTMHGIQHGRVFRNELVTLVELSYDRYSTSMLIALPAEGKSAMTELLRSLDAETLEGWLDEAEYSEITLDLPRFSLDGGTLDLTQTLGAAGLGVLLGAEADLSGFGGEPGELLLDAVLHACKVQVDEEGTVAAAASALIPKCSSAVAPPTVEVQVNRPFLFMVREGRSGELLVMGRVEDPRGGTRP